MPPPVTTFLEKTRKTMTELTAVLLQKPNQWFWLNLFPLFVHYFSYLFRCILLKNKFLTVHSSFTVVVGLVVLISCWVFSSRSRQNWVEDGWMDGRVGGWADGWREGKRGWLNGGLVKGDGGRSVVAVAFASFTRPSNFALPTWRRRLRVSEAKTKLAKWKCWGKSSCWIFLPLKWQVASGKWQVGSGRGNQSNAKSLISSEGDRSAPHGFQLKVFSSQELVQLSNHNRHEIPSTIDVYFSFFCFKLRICMRFSS